MNSTADTFSELKPKVVLGVAAHTDDLDVLVAGTVATWSALGTEVYYLILTDGSKGSADRQMTSNDLIKIRQNEQRDACKILGIRDVFFLDYEDGALMCDIDVKRDIVRVIRQTKPDVVITMDPTMTYSAERGYINHPDHRTAGQATLDAVFPLARDHLSFPELLSEGLEPHISPTVLLVNFEDHNYMVDITNVIDKKMKALAAHKSQFSDMKGLQTFIRQFAAEIGKLNKTDYAEAFVRIDIR